MLQEHPAVADVARLRHARRRVGREREGRGRARARLRRRRRALAAELLAFARERLAGYKVPRSIDFDPALPRTPTGKLAVRVLRERHWRGTGRRI